MQQEENIYFIVLIFIFQVGVINDFKGIHEKHSSRLEIQVSTKKLKQPAKETILSRSQSPSFLSSMMWLFPNVGKKSRLTSGSSGTGVSSWVFEVMFARHMPSSQRGNT